MLLSSPFGSFASLLVHLPQLLPQPQILRIDSTRPLLMQSTTALKNLQNEDCFKGLNLYLRTATTQLAPTQQYLDDHSCLPEAYYTEMLTVFSRLAEHCKDFQEPHHQVALLADSVVTYVEYVQAFYLDIDKHFEILDARTEPPNTLQANATKLRLIFTSISDRTDPLASKVGEAIIAVDQFKQHTREDVQEVERLNESVTQAHFDAKRKIVGIKRDIEEKRKMIEKFQRGYAATLEGRLSVPWYASVPLFGIIAASIPSTQTTRAETSYQTEIQRLTDEIGKLVTDLALAEELKTTAEHSSAQVKQVCTHIAGGLESLTIMAAAWRSIADNIGTLMTSLAFWLGLDVVEAVIEFPRRKKNWAEIGNVANELSHALAFAERVTN